MYDKIIVLSKEVAQEYLEKGIIEEIEEMSFPKGLYMHCTDADDNDYFYLISVNDLV